MSELWRGKFVSLPDAGLRAAVLVVIFFVRGATAVAISRSNGEEGGGGRKASSLDLGTHCGRKDVMSERDRGARREKREGGEGGRGSFCDYLEGLDVGRGFQVHFGRDKGRKRERKMAASEVKVCSAHPEKRRREEKPKASKPHHNPEEIQGGVGVQSASYCTYL